MVVVEFENQPGIAVLPRPATDVITGSRYEGEVTIPPYGVFVLQEE